MSKIILISLFCSVLELTSRAEGNGRELETCYGVSDDRLTGPLKTLLFSADWISVLRTVNLAVETKGRNYPTPVVLIYPGVRKRMCLLWPPVSG